MILLPRQGALGDALKTSQEFANRLRAARDQVIKTAIAFGEILLPFALKVVNVFIALNKWIQKLTPSMKRVTLLIAAVLALIGPLILSFTLLVQLGLAVQKTFLAIRTAMAASNVTMGVFLAKFALIGAAIIAVLALLALFVDDIANFVDGNESFIGRFLEPWETLGPKIKAALQPFINAFMAAWEIVKSIGTDIMDFIDAVLVGNVEVAAVAIEDILRKSFDVYARLLSIFITVLGKLGMVIWNKIIKNLPAISSFIQKAIVTAGKAIGIAIGNIVDDILDSISKKFMGFFSSIKDEAGDFFSGLFGNGGNFSANISGNPQSIGGALAQSQSVTNANRSVQNNNNFNMPLTMNVPSGTPEQQTASLANEIPRMVSEAIQNEVNTLSFSTGAVQ